MLHNTLFCSILQCLHNAIRSTMPLTMLSQYAILLHSTMPWTSPALYHVLLHSSVSLVNVPWYLLCTYIGQTFRKYSPVRRSSRYISICSAVYLLCFCFILLCCSSRLFYASACFSSDSHRTAVRFLNVGYPVGRHPYKHWTFVQST